MNDLQRSFDLFGESYRVCAGLLLDRQDDCGLATVTCIAAFDPRGKIDDRHLPQQHRLALPIGNDSFP